MQKIRQGTCAYCGAVGEVTDDHVIPQCLWGRVKGAPKSAPVIDACSHCNSIWKSGNDSYLRDVLINDRGAASHPVAGKIRPKFIRSVLRNQSDLDRDIREKGKIVLAARPSGIVVPSLEIEEVEERMKKILFLVIRGLHFYYLHEPLPSDLSFWVAQLQTSEQREVFSKDIALISGVYHRGGSQCVDDGAVFSCAYVELEPNEHSTLWLLTFYRNVVFGAVTNPVQQM